MSRPPGSSITICLPRTCSWRTLSWAICLSNSACAMRVYDKTISRFRSFDVVRAMTEQHIQRINDCMTNTITLKNTQTESPMYFNRRERDSLFTNTSTIYNCYVYIPRSLMLCTARSIAINACDLCACANCANERERVIRIVFIFSSMPNHYGVHACSID